MEGIQSLQNDLVNPDLRVRRAAAEQFSTCGPAATPVVVSLVAACGDADEQVRELVIATLEELGPPPVDALGELIKLSRSDDPNIAYWAITVTGRMESDAIEAESSLVELLDQTTDASVAERAVWALDKIGAKSRETARVLERASRSENPRLVRLANRALESIDND